MARPLDPALATATAGHAVLVVARRSAGLGLPRAAAHGSALGRGVEAAPGVSLSVRVGAALYISAPCIQPRESYVPQQTYERLTPPGRRRRQDRAARRSIRCDKT